MQNELTALRPQLLETSDETEKLMIKIEQDTIQVGNIIFVKICVLVGGFSVIERWYLKDLDLVSKN